MLTPAIESIKNCLGETAITALQAQCFIEHEQHICFEIRRPQRDKQRLFVTLTSQPDGYGIRVDRVSKRRRLICEVTGQPTPPEKLADVLSHAMAARGKSEQWLAQIGLSRPGRKAHKARQLVLELYKADLVRPHYDIHTTGLFATV